MKTTRCSPGILPIRRVRRGPEGKVLGRMATKIADVLRGKHKATFTPNSDMGISSSW